MPGFFLVTQIPPPPKYLSFQLVEFNKNEIQILHVASNVLYRNENLKKKRKSQLICNKNYPIPSYFF